MAERDRHIAELRTLKDQIRRASVSGFLMLNDLQGSTAYKTWNDEATWLSRLFDFYDVVGTAVPPSTVCKYLGDGVLNFIPAEATDGPDIVRLAKAVQAAVATKNAARGYRAGHQLAVRTVLAAGNVQLYGDIDPQGTAVDALFRMEKFVPAGCIGLLDPLEVWQASDALFVGAYTVRGLSEARQKLWLVGSASTSALIAGARQTADLHDVWDLGEDGSGNIHVINGYVPELTGEPATIQLGDVRAEQLVYSNLVRVGRSNDIVPMTTRDHDESHLRENIVCLGGPYWNIATRRMMRELNLPLRFDFETGDDRSPLIDGRAGRTFESMIANDCVTRDCGFFLRAVNPLNPRRHVIIAAGIETYAVYGIVEAFSARNSHFSDLCRSVRSGADDGSPLPDFYSVMSVNVERTGRVMLPSLSDQVSHIHRNWERDSKWQLQADPLDH